MAAAPLGADCQFGLFDRIYGLNPDIDPYQLYAKFLKTGVRVIHNTWLIIAQVKNAVAEILMTLATSKSSRFTTTSWVFLRCFRYGFESHYKSVAQSLKHHFRLYRN